MQIYTHHSLQHYNTFGIDAYASIFVVLENKNDIESALIQYWKPKLILWWWSNIVLTKDIEWVVWHPKFLERTITNEWDNIILTCGAGYNWHEIVLYTIENWWRGIENLIAIPGNIWSAPVQNIWAYWVQLEDCFISLEAYDLEEQSYIILDKQACNFWYRDSIFKQNPWKYLICNISLVLWKQWKPNLSYKQIADIFSAQWITTPSQKEVAEAIEKIRRSKLPKPEDLWNCGSFFKNPIVSKSYLDNLLLMHPTIPHYPYDTNNEKLSAARLIDNAWLKWIRHGNIWTYIHQPLIIVNYWWWTWYDIVLFSDHLIQRVYDTFGITLHREVNIF